MTDSKDTTSSHVTQVGTIEVINAEGSSFVESELRYDSRDPYAATIAFMVGDTEVSWTFARDLLRDGLSEPSGLGDVHLRPCLDSDAHSVVVIELLSPEGAALVQARAGDLRRFVDRTTALVPPGAESEHLDIDAVVARMLV